MVSSKYYWPGLFSDVRQYVSKIFLHYSLLSVCIEIECVSPSSGNVVYTKYMNEHFNVNFG